MLFLAGAWAAVFSSLLGVWQAVPYLFADFWHLQSRRKSLSAENFEPYQVDTRGKAYRGYLLALALLPLLGLGYDFQIVQKVYSVFGALVMPIPPPMRSTSRLQIARPRPVPSSLVV